MLTWYLFPILTVLGKDQQQQYQESRSIKTSLDKVIGEVKSRLEAVFASSKQAPGNRRRAGSRLIETPIESILPASWLVEDNNFLFPDMPMDVEVQEEDLTKQLEELRPKKKKHRKHKKRKKKHQKYIQKRMKSSNDQFYQKAVLPKEASGPKVYDKYLEEYHAGTAINRIANYSQRVCRRVCRHS